MDAPLVVEPRPVAPDFGFATPGEALAAAGFPADDAASRPVLVVVNDPDRATRSAEALAAVRARAGTRRIEILVATGAHRFPTDVRTAHAAPLLAAAGSPSRIGWHDAHEPYAHARLPVTRRSMSKYAQILAATSEVVVVGSVEPHWFAGVTGAHKALTVGLFEVGEIERNHANAVYSDARPFRLAGNPVFDDLRPAIEEICARHRPVAVQHVGDRWLAGDPLATLPALAAAAEARWLVRVREPLDHVVCRVEPPLSRTLYQAEKAVKHTEFSVRDGGVIAVVAECEDGTGPTRFVEMMRSAADGVTLLAQVTRQGYRLGDHKALRLRSLLDRGVRLFLVSASMDAAAGGRAPTVAGFTVVPTLDAIRPLLAGRGADVRDAAHCVLEVG